MSKGINETVEIIDFIKKLGETISNINKDGKVDIFDAVEAIQLTPYLYSAIHGSDHIKEELMDLDAKEKDFLIQEMKDAILIFIKSIKGNK